MSLLGETLSFYRQRKAEEKQKKNLLNAKTDFALLEQFIQKCNDNPALRIEIRLKDGTKLLMKTHVEKNNRDLINGDYEVIE